MRQVEMHTITATARVFVVVPGSADTAALFKDDEVTTFVLLDQINSHAHP
jgi:hypothetical protein